MSDEAYLGKEKIPLESVVVVPKPTYLLDFKCYERQGLTIYLDEGQPYLETELKPVYTKDGLKVGDHILVPDPLRGGYWRAVVSGDKEPMGFEGEQVFGSLFFDLGHPDGVPAEWVALCIGNTKALARIDFS